MVKAKVLADRIQITSDVLTDENLKKVKLFAPRALKLFDELDTDNKVLYEVALCEGEYNTFNMNGAVFKAGKTLACIERNEEDSEEDIRSEIVAVMRRLAVIEEQVTEVVSNINDTEFDIEFMD